MHQTTPMIFIKLMLKVIQKVHHTIIVILYTCMHFEIFQRELLFSS